MKNSDYSFRTRLFKWLRYSGLAFLLFLLQSAGVMPELFNTTPNFLFILPLLVAACEGPFGGAYFALGCGILYDVIYPGTAGFYPLMSVVFCFLTGALTKTSLRNNLVSLLLVGGVSVLLTKLAEWILFVRYPEIDVTAFTLYSSTLPSVIYTVLFIPPLYYLVLWIKNRYDVITD